MIKKFVALGLFLFLMASPAFGEILMWDPIQDDSVTEVRVFESTTQGQYNYASPTYTAPKNQNYVVLTRGNDDTRYYWVARATDGTNDSVDSTEVSWVYYSSGGGGQGPAAPGGIGIIDCNTVQSGQRGYEECSTAKQLP